MATSENRKNITQPADWWEAFDAAAKREGIPLSQWMGDACRAALPKKVTSKLSERTKGRPKSPDINTTSDNSGK